MPEYGFNDNGERVAISQPAAPDAFREICQLLICAGASEAFMEKVRLPLQEILDGHDDTYNVETVEGLGEFFRVMTDDATPLQAGQRLFVLAFLAGKLKDAATQRQMAAQLNVTPGRITQIKQAIPAKFLSLFGADNHNAKHRGQ